MNFRRMLSLLASMAMALTALSGAMTVSADTDSGDCGDGKWSYDSSTGKLTISGQGKMASPDVRSIKTSDIQSEIGDHSDIYTYKKYKEDIKEVVIEEGVTTVGFCAFYKMPNLETVVLPSTITEFEGPYDLMINIENSTGGSINFDHPLVEHPCYSFAECSKLKNLTLTEGMKSIGAFAFEGCTSLESVTIPSTIEVIYEENSDVVKSAKWGAYSFNKCSSLKNITLSDGLETIGAYVFANTAVESVVIPSTVKAWGICGASLGVSIGNRGNHNSAFDNCNKLSSVIIEEGIETIGPGVFSNCSSLKKLAIPSSIKNITYAFALCTGLEEAYIEEGAKISKYDEPSDTRENSNFQNAFLNCVNLKRLEIPEGVAVSYSNANWCDGCTSLEEVYLHNKDYKQGIMEPNSIVSYYCYPNSTTYSKISTQLKSVMRVPDITKEISRALEEVKTAASEAEGLVEADYTAESYGVLKALLEKAAKYGDDSNIMSMEDTAEAIRAAIAGLEEKPEEPTTPSSSQSTTSKITTKAPTTTAIAKTTRSADVVKKDKAAAEKAMKQAKITKLTAKSKAKKKITVSWKKVKKAVGYQVQVSNKKNFKKVIFNKETSKKKLNIKNNKIKSKKTYYVRVRAYATYKDKNGVAQKVYSKWNKKLRKVKTK